MDEEHEFPPDKIIPQSHSFDPKLSLPFSGLSSVTGAVTALRFRQKAETEAFIGAGKGFGNSSRRKSRNPLCFWASICIMSTTGETSSRFDRRPDRAFLDQVSGQQVFF